MASEKTRPTPCFSAYSSAAPECPSCSAVTQPPLGVNHLLFLHFSVSIQQDNTTRRQVKESAHRLWSTSGGLYVYPRYHHVLKTAKRVLRLDEMVSC